MLNAIFVGFCTLTPIIAALWVWYCMHKTHKDIILLNDRTTDYFQPHWASPESVRHYDWTWSERKDVSPEAHCWRRLTFHNPWKLYGPITISLVRGYQMDDEFWEWYKLIYKDFMFKTDRDNITRWMAGCKQITAYPNPMIHYLSVGYGYDINDFKPNSKPAMMEGAAEYDEIMQMQEAVERL